MPDEIRELLEESYDRAESTAPEAAPVETEAAPSVEDETNIESSEQQSSESAASSNVAEPVADDPSQEGSATPSGEEVKPITEVVSDANDTPEPVISADQVQVTDKKIQNAPASWKGEAKALWDSLPITARQEIARRETQTQQVLNETAADRKRIQSINQVIAPHRERINAVYGGNPLNAINGLMQTESILSTGNTATKARVVAKIINDFGVDISALDAVLSGGELPPEAKQQNELDQVVNQRLAPVMNYVRQQQEKEQQLLNQRRQGIVTTVQQMAADTVNFPYFQQVREEMADIIEMSAKRNVEVSFEEAYDKAVKFNGMTARAVDTRQNVQADTTAALSAHQEAQKAKEASVSVSGNPNSTSPPVNQNTDLRSLISDALEGGGSRV